MLSETGFNEIISRLPLRDAPTNQDRYQESKKGVTAAMMATAVPEGDPKRIEEQSIHVQCTYTHTHKQTDASRSVFAFERYNVVE